MLMLPITPEGLLLESRPIVEEKLEQVHAWQAAKEAAGGRLQCPPPEQVLSAIPLAAKGVPLEPSVSSLLVPLVAQCMRVALFNIERAHLERLAALPASNSRAGCSASSNTVLAVPQAAQHQGRKRVSALRRGPRKCSSKRPRQGGSGGCGVGRDSGHGSGQGHSRRSGHQISSAGNEGNKAQPNPFAAGVLEEAAEDARDSMAALQHRADGRPARQAALAAKMNAAWKK